MYVVLTTIADHFRIHIQGELLSEYCTYPISLVRFDLGSTPYRIGFIIAPKGFFGLSLIRSSRTSIMNELTFRAPTHVAMRLCICSGLLLLIRFSMCNWLVFISGKVAILYQIPFGYFDFAFCCSTNLFYFILHYSTVNYNRNLAKIHCYF